MTAQKDDFSMADTLKNGVVYGVVLYGKGVLDAQNALYSEQKPTVRTTKHVNKAERRIAKSLESQGCVGSNPTRSAICKGSGHRRFSVPGYFFACGAICGAVHNKTGYSGWTK